MHANFPPPAWSSFLWLSFRSNDLGSAAASESTDFGVPSADYFTVWGNYRILRRMVFNVWLMLLWKDNIIAILAHFGAIYARVKRHLLTIFILIVLLAVVSPLGS